MHTRHAERNAHFCFCQNFVKFPRILISFGSLHKKIASGKTCMPPRVEQFTGASSTRRELCAFQASTENIWRVKFQNSLITLFGIVFSVNWEKYFSKTHSVHRTRFQKVEWVSFFISIRELVNHGALRQFQPLWHLKFVEIWRSSDKNRNAVFLTHDVDEAIITNQCAEL